MKLKRKLFLVLILFVVFLFPIEAFALNEVNLYLFWGDGCPHCEKEMEFLSELESRYTNLKVYKYETWGNAQNKEHLEKIRELYGNENKGVPFTIIGDDFVSGFNDSRKASIENLIRKYSLEDYEDKAGLYFNITHKTNLEGSLPPIYSGNNSALENNNNNNNSNSSNSNDNLNSNLDSNKEVSNIDDKVVITLVCLILIIVLTVIYFLTRKKRTIWKNQ